ncbi:NUDIX domain-containing protein [Hyphomicrobium sulfonivorans]|uniref:NUDIX domain-containing protein n=1 Tax=Hyphomicrobium sulfonivorans TaxID=121290 RepID=UPI0009F93E85|nr:NUDIX domain-containing protein [Hyphomicrobium sulfonivorans]
MRPINNRQETAPEGIAILNDAAKYVLKKALQRYWRLTRGMTLGAQGVLIDPQGRIVLIRHTYVQGWRFPGGGVEHGETIVEALRRELREETGAEITAEPELFGIYSSAPVFPNDHVALYLVRNWQRDRVPAPNHEIAEHGLFAPDDLPADVSDGTARRIAEIFVGAPQSTHW